MKKYRFNLLSVLTFGFDSNIGNIEPDKSLYEECTPKRIIEDLNLTY